MTEIALSTDRRMLTLRIATPLDAQQVEQLIHDLADARQDMTPEPAQSFAEAAATDALLLDLGKPLVRFQPNGTDVDLIFRTAGLGWATMQLARATVLNLPLLLGEELPDRRRPQ
ncbi:hypothetical protein [Marilutibacter alkalisoli]|uniref:Uncharacterized protein n=1 Tax=Marilutibacter alkalisoli TaxID=2591633 RepID=A0A514BTZ0_9GAMM|nr:hypothetical protein [Lysobacter alkalisoli]QDH70863.1 hypothetical protein FKV23_12795 [Lysobacter alkalisoli]